MVRAREREACKFNLRTFQLRLGELCIKKRRSEHISAETLARNIGISRTALYGFINGEYIPKADTLVMIANYFCVSLDWLMGMSIKELKGGE